MAGLVLLLLLWPGCGAQVAARAQGALIDLVWSDPDTGFALGGYDVVAYFLQAEPVQGRAAHEARWQGDYFRFVNEGNRQAFLADPGVYLPAFGGHSPVQMAAGRLAEGDPRIWLVEGGRLLFFTSQAERRQWQMGRNSFARRANRHWLRMTGS